MIPKKIHYFWFSNEPFPQIIQKCLDSWKKYCSDYEIILWNTDNFNVHINKWCSQAFNAKKYAFVTDYARLYVLYHEGGIFLDTDVEVIQPLDKFLDNIAFFSFTAKEKHIQAETIGSEKNNIIIRELLDYYENRPFIQFNGKFDEKIIDEILYDYFITKGLINDDTEQTVKNTKIYPPGYFLMSDDILYFSYYDCIKYLLNTHTIHYAAGGWCNSSSKLYRNLKNQYLTHFKTICKLIQNPIIFKLFVTIINIYRVFYWKNHRTPHLN